jgi:hypothetical protein
MDVLKEVVQQSGASICLSSNWRCTPWGRAQVDKHLEQNELEPAVGYTHPVEDHFNTRADEILDWLHQHPEVTHFVVLDDIALNFEDPDATVPECIASRFLQVDESTGLQPTDAASALAKLEVALERSTLVRARLLDVEADEAEDAVELFPVLQDGEGKPPEAADASSTSGGGGAIVGGLGSRTASCSSFAGLGLRHPSATSLSGMGSRNPSSSNLSRIASGDSVSGMVRLSRRESRGSLEGMARD